MANAKGMMTCKVCGRDFALIAEEHYVARDPEETGLAAVLGRNPEAKWYDAFDCPHCGCQNVVQERKMAVLQDVIEAEEINQEEEEE